MRTQFVKDRRSDFPVAKALPLNVCDELFIVVTAINTYIKSQGKMKTHLTSNGCTS